MAITVILQYHTGNIAHEARMAADAEVKRLIPAVVTAMGLPITDPAGRPITYHLSHNGRRLQENETLQSAGVQNVDSLTLVPEMTAIPDEDNVFICPKSGQTCSHEVSRNNMRALVLMPFGKGFDGFYDDVIKPTISEWGFAALRSDEIISHKDILCKICHLILDSNLNIVDITNQNPNVFLELGILYGIGRKAILIKRVSSNLPTDTIGLEYIPYSNDKRPQFRKKLLQAMAQNTGHDFLKNTLCPTCQRPLIGSSKGPILHICMNDEVQHEERIVLHQQCWIKQQGCPICGKRHYIELDSRNL